MVADGPARARWGDGGRGDGHGGVGPGAGGLVSRSARSLQLSLLCRMDAREPLKRICKPTAVLCAVTTIAFLASPSMGRAAGTVPLSEIPPRAYVVATYDGSVLRLYLNAEPVAATL